MKLLSIIYFLSFLGVSLSIPIGIRGRNLGISIRDLSDLKSSSQSAATAAKGSTSDSAAKASSTGGAASGNAASGNIPSAASVKAAVSAFASDANTVSSSLNNLATATDANTIKSLASTGFTAESDEDSRRSVLAAAAGTAGATPNGKIVQNTPAVLTGLKNIMNNPTPATATKNLATIENAR